MVRSAAVVLATILVLAACAGPPETATPAPPSPEPATPGEGEETPEPPAEVPEILEFAAPRLGGGQVQGAELAGRDVALWFWAPW